MEDDGEQERLPRKKETFKVREQWVGIYVEFPSFEVTYP